jgi:hypothetical protein
MSQRKTCYFVDNGQIIKIRDFCERAAFLPHCSGCPFPSPYLKGVGIRKKRIMPSARFERCARQHPGHGGHLGKPARSSRVAAWPEGQATPPHVFNLQMRLSPPRHGFSWQAVTPGVKIRVNAFLNPDWNKSKVNFECNKYVQICHNISNTLILCFSYKTWQFVSLLF